MDSCDTRTRAYKNGKTFPECEKIAESMTDVISSIINQNGKISWTEILKKVEHDELVYKLTLKYLRKRGYDIGDWQTPEVKKSVSI